MKALRWLLFSATLLSASCASTPSQRDATWLPQEARASPQQHVVVTVHNDASIAAQGVGSTPRGMAPLPHTPPAGRRAMKRAPSPESTNCMR